MKIICIDNGRNKGLKMDCPPVIQEGETYEAIDTFYRDGWWYHELSIQPGFGYLVELFVPVSEVHEMELYHQKQPA